MLDYRGDVFVEKLQRSDAEDNQSKSFQQFEGSDEPQARAMGSFSGHFLTGLGFYPRNSRLYCAGFLAPFLQLRPQLGERAEFSLAADEYRNVALQSVRIVRRADIFHLLVKFFESFAPIV